MPTVTTETVRSDGVTLVEIRVSADGPHRVSLAVRADGPVWPPRDTDEGPTWDERTVTLEASSRPTGVGFATPTPADAVDVEVVAAEPVDDGLPDGIRAWLDAVETRVAEAERLAAADDLRAATAAVAAVGGLAEVETLSAALQRDREVLSRLSFAPDELRQRAEAVDLPVGSLSAVAQSRRSW
jgi:hypothetical protein